MLGEWWEAGQVAKASGPADLEAGGNPCSLDLGARLGRWWGSGDGVALGGRGEGGFIQVIHQIGYKDGQVIESLPLFCLLYQILVWGSAQG